MDFLAPLLGSDMITNKDTEVDAKYIRQVNGGRIVGIALVAAVGGVAGYFLLP